MTPLAWIEIILALSIPILPVAFLWHRTVIKKKDGSHFGDGVRVVQFVGVAILPQTIALLGLEGKLDGGTIAALIGAFVGYLLGGLTEFDRRRSES